jgi:hypothetical protein
MGGMRPDAGLKKQIEWARSIASNHCNAIAIAQKKVLKFQPPQSGGLITATI